jgi:hypothetical protein
VDDTERTPVIVVSAVREVERAQHLVRDEERDGHGKRRRAAATERKSRASDKPSTYSSAMKTSPSLSPKSTT